MEKFGQTNAKSGKIRFQKSLVYPTPLKIPGPNPRENLHHFTTLYAKSLFHHAPFRVHKPNLWLAPPL